MFILVGPYFANANHGAEVGIFSALKSLRINTVILDYRTQQCLFYLNGQQSAPVEWETGIRAIIGFGLSNNLILCPGPGLPDSVYESDWWKSLKGIKINWNSEPIRLKCYENKIKKSLGHFDYYMTFDESEIDLYKKIGIEAKFLPQAYNPDWYHPLLGEPQQDACFIGSTGGKWRHRLLMLERANKVCSITTGYIMDARKVNEIYNNHKVILNLGLYCDDCGDPQELRGFGLQQRIFEAIGAGRVCLTNEISDNQLYIPLVFYNHTNLEEQLRELITNNKYRMNIEDQVLAYRHSHTYEARIYTLFIYIGGEDYWRKWVNIC